MNAALKIDTLLSNMGVRVVDTRDTRLRLTDSIQVDGFWVPVDHSINSGYTTSTALPEGVRRGPVLDAMVDIVRRKVAGLVFSGLTEPIDCLHSLGRLVYSYPKGWDDTIKIKDCDIPSLKNKVITINARPYVVMQTWSEVVGRCVVLDRPLDTGAEVLSEVTGGTKNIGSYHWGIRPGGVTAVCPLKETQPIGELIDHSSGGVHMTETRRYCPDTQLTSVTFNLIMGMFCRPSLCWSSSQRNSN